MTLEFAIAMVLAVALYRPIRWVSDKIADRYLMWSSKRDDRKRRLELPK
ncbi:MAG: hypothetical protein WBG86_17905 [Polyangiales bacterium]